MVTQDIFAGLPSLGELKGAVTSGGEQRDSPALLQSILQSVPGKHSHFLRENWFNFLSPLPSPFPTGET